MPVNFAEFRLDWNFIFMVMTLHSIMVWTSVPEFVFIGKCGDLVVSVFIAVGVIILSIVLNLLIPQVPYY